MKRLEIWVETFLVGYPEFPKCKRTWNDLRDFHSRMEREGKYSLGILEVRRESNFHFSPKIENFHNVSLSVLMMRFMWYVCVVTIVADIWGLQPWPRHDSPIAIGASSFITSWLRGKLSGPKRFFLPNPVLRMQTGCFTEDLAPYIFLIHLDKPLKKWSALIED